MANFINIYTNIYTCIYVMIMTQNKNDSINSILQHRRAVDKNCCVVFPTSGFSYLILCPKQSKWKVAYYQLAKLATTYLAIRTKNN